MEPPEFPPSTNRAPPPPPSVAEAIVSSCDDLGTHQRCCCSCSWARRSGHPPAAHGSIAAATPVPSEMPATTTKKADAAQPPHNRAPVQSPAAQCAGKCQNSSELWCHGWRPAGGRGIAYKAVYLSLGCYG
ncbi:uncharacterized protein LOC120664273 [Panicum virgatum]|uniref:uncharacterized protein LOC120664273 n=1 Tax=Panicum virgatum TaxID=38727 RepID=UPI0019D541E3|nr:uncharacterized protein LOC120664273 [Panicum virgatum]